MGKTCASKQKFEHCVVLKSFHFCGRLTHRTSVFIFNNTKSINNLEGTGLNNYLIIKPDVCYSNAMVMKKTSYSLLLIGFLLFAGIRLNAQLFTRTFTGTGACPTQDNSVMTITGASLSDVTRGSFVSCNATANVFNSSFTATGTSIDLTKYVEFTVTAAAGYDVTLTSITYDRQRSGSGCQNSRVAHNFGGNFTTTYLDDATVPTSAAAFPWDFTDFTIISGNSVTFRIYGWNNSAGGTFRIDNLKLFGSVASSVANTVSVGVSPTSTTETATNTVTITVTSSSTVSGNQTVDYAITGTGITSSDFVGSPALTGTITILNGNTTGTATVQVADDVDIEGTETATVTISNPSAGITLGSPASANFSIGDNDTPPSITTTPNSLTGFCATTSVASASQSYTVTGTNLSPASGSVTVNATGTGWEVSSDNVTFSNSIALNYTGAALNATVYARLKSGLTAGSKSGNIAHTGGGIAATVNTAVSGEVHTPVFNPGDISVVGVNSSGTDGIEFANWVNIPAGAQFFITDRNWSGSGWSSTENTFTWTNGASILAPGTVTVLQGSSVDNGSYTAGVVNGIDNVAGDNIFIYEGSATCPYFIHGYIFKSSWGGAISSLPASLNVTEGNIQNASPAQDNNEYTAGRNTLTSFAAYKTAVHNLSNWGAAGASLNSTDFTLASLNTIVIDAINGAPYTLTSCTGTVSGTVDYTATGVFNAGNVFTVQMSDASGTFASPVTIGTLNSTALTGSINITIPASTASSSNYKLRILSSDLPATGTPSSAFTITLSATGCPVAGDYRTITSGNWNANTTWEKFNGTGWVACASGDHPNSTTTSAFIRNGHVVTFTVSGKQVKNLNVEAGGQLYANINSPATGPRYLEVYGNVVCDGQIGNGPSNSDVISLKPEAANVTISGSGTCDLARLIKDVTATNTSLMIDMDLGLHFADWSSNGSNTALYNNKAGAQYNVTVNTGRTVTFYNKADLSIDATNGQSATDLPGTFIIKGTVTGVGNVFARANQTAGKTCKLQIQPGGALWCDTLVYDPKNTSGTAGVEPFVLDIQAGGTLRISNILAMVSTSLNPAGDVILSSTAANSNATLCDGGMNLVINSPVASSVTCNGSFTGTLKVERFVPVTGSNQHFVSSPVNSAPFSQINASGTDGAYIIPAANCDETQSDVSSPYGSVFEYTDGHAASGACMLGNWKIRSTGSLDNGRGYSAYLNGNDITTFSGVPNTGNLSVSGFNSGYPSVNTLQGQPVQSGWNLVGNPYASPIQLTTDRTAAGYGNQVQVWVTTGPFSGTWQPGLMGAGASSAVIAPGQAFMVRRTGAGAGNFPFYQIERFAGISTAFFLQQNDNALTLELDYNGAKDATIIAFNSNATSNFDNAYDANKRGANGRPSLYTLMGGADWYGINTLPSLNQTTAVPVGLRAGVNGTMSISAQGMQAFDPTVYMILEDKKTNTFHNLRNGNYTFTASVNDAQDRFVLHFTPAVEIQADNATCANNNGSISFNNPGGVNWQYSIENNGVVMAGGTLQSTTQVNGLPAGVYTLVLTDANNYQVVKNIMITAPVTPDASFAASTVVAQQNQLIDFTTTNVSSNTYNWNFGDGTTSNDASTTHLYQQEGTYTVQLQVTGSEGCSASSSKLLTVTTATTTGITNTTADGISIYANGDNVVVNLGKTTATVEVFNLLGETLFSEKATGLLQHNFNALPAQCLLVRVNDGSHTTVKKVVITH